MIWFVFSVFCFLLWIRKKVDPRRKYEPRSVVFETLCHLAGCETTDFNNKSGRLISFTMTIGFFFVFAYYLNLMSTEMVVQEKPETLNSYQDMMNRENMTVVGIKSCSLKSVIQKLSFDITLLVLVSIGLLFEAVFIRDSRSQVIFAYILINLLLH